MIRRSSLPAARVARPGRRALAFVFATVLIDMIGIGLIVPVLPDMIRDIAGTDLSGASALGGWLFVAYSAMQFLFGPAIGNLSDRIGRRPVLLASVLGLGVDYVVTAFAPSIMWLFVGRILAGICGASYVTANAYIADVTRPEDRARAFGLIGAAFGIGFVLGPAVGGLLGHFGHKIPFFVAAGFSLANLVVGAIALPESLPPERRRAFDLRRANPLGALLGLRRHPAAGPLALALFLFCLAQSVYVSIWAYSTMQRYGWSEGLVGLSLAAVGIAAAVNQGGVAGPAIARLGERRAAFVSLAVALVSAVGYAVAWQGWMVFGLIALTGSQGIAMPAMNAMMSRGAPQNAQGELQGAIASLQGIASIAGPPVMAGLFSAFTRQDAPVDLPGAPFWLAAGLVALSMVVLWRSRAGVTGPAARSTSRRSSQT